jgi:hypothetical protein
MTYRTRDDIEYKAAPYGRIATIPKGTQCVEASNLPAPRRYWAEPWPNMTDKAAGWIGGYGFLLDASEVEAVSDEL